MRIRMKKTTAMILAIIMGLILFVSSLSLLISPHVQCGDQTMSQGDTCVTISSNGSGGENDYSGQQRKQLVLGIAGLVLGALIGAYGVYELVSWKRQKRMPASPMSAPSASDEKLQHLTFEELMTLGKQKQQARLYSEALNAFRQATKKKPWDAPAHYCCAQVLLHLHNQSAALQALDQTLATALLPNQKQIILDASYQKALLLKERKQYHQALETLDELLQLDLENVKALAARAELLVLVQSQQT